ncbi:MAG: hypothetical protein IJJ99_00925 [Oscillospiraceae bacterium]|nr:hypothetical protein [Oscillospiraceae bacterium]
MQKHKILAFLLALVVSIGLWVYAVTVVNPNDSVTVHDVRVRITGESALKSDGLMLTGGENQTVNVEISGRRSDLKELSSSSVEVIADVSNIDSPGTYEVSWKIGLPSTVASGDISIVSASSTRIKVTVSEYKERPAIPVEVEYVGKLPDGYVRDPAELDRETVAISGPAEEVGKIARAVVTVDQDGATDSIAEEMEYRLVDENGEELEMSEYVTIADPTVYVTVPISYYKQIDLKVKIIDGGGATQNDVELTIEPKTIGVVGSEEALKDLEELIIKEIDLAEVMKDSQSWTVTPELPAGVTNRASEKTVTITLAFVGIQTKTFTIPCADIERENDVASLEFGEPSVKITVRGTKEALSALRAEDILVIADMTNEYDEAMKTVTLRIELPKSTTAGVIGGPYVVQVIETAN